MPLPLTGLQQQVQSLQAQYQQLQPGQLPAGQRMAGRTPTSQMSSSTGIGGGGVGTGGGASPGQTPSPGNMVPGGTMPQAPKQPMGSTSLSALASSLAQNYGLSVGRMELVDPSGNITMTPDQIVAMSGGKETLGSAASKLNLISSAIANEQNARQAAKAEASLQAGAGLVRSRGRGSAALMQSGYYQQLASLYDAQEYDAADYSYYIMKEQMDFQREMMRRAEKLAKKRALGGAIGGILGAGVGAVLGGPIGAGIGMQAGSALGGGGGGGGWF